MAIQVELVAYRAHKTMLDIGDVRIMITMA